jgi:Nuclease-related domain/UvrD-like helicase C-terminal domain/AAA domain
VFAGLPDDYTVYCNRRWHTPPKGGKAAQPAEADFVVAHPNRGILVVEVKGGRIRYEPATDSWYSNDLRLRESPFAQVQRTRYRLRDVLNASRTRGIEFPLGEAVAFPDVDVKPGDIPLGDVEERVIDAADVHDLEPALIRAFDAFGLEDNEAVFGRRGVHALTDTIAGSVELRRSVGGMVAESEAEIIRLTENEYEILDGLDGNQRVVVLGGAGTGKTLLAIEEAKRLAAQGLRVLFTCFNQPLGIYLAGQLKDLSGVEALHFHGICTNWARAAGIDFARRDDDSEREYYEVRAPNLLTEAAEKLNRRVDAVLVDEAQDFLPEWIDALELLLEDRDGIAFLFADENQSIYRRGFSAPPGFFTYHLNSNLRNAASIHRLLVEHFGETSASKGPAGVEVAVRTWRAEKDLRKELSRVLSSFRDNGIPSELVTVLTGRSVKSSRLADGDGHVGAFRVCSNPKGAGEIRLASVHRFKGLESSVVILCEMEELDPATRRSLWYTGLSRARSALVLLIQDKDGSVTGKHADEAVGQLLKAGTTAEGTR